MEQTRTRDITNALLGILNGTAATVGDGEMPAGAGWQGPPGSSEFVGFIVLRSYTGGMTRTAGRGTITSPDADALSYYELLGVGATRDQAELLGDMARSHLVGARPTVAGRSIQSIAVEELGGTERDDTTEPGEPRVWISADLICVSSTPRAD